MTDTQLQITLQSLTYGGDAMGRLPDGRAVFVPFGLPGERVLIRLLEEKRGYCRGKLLSVLEPSPERITPRCQHFSVCGGCHYQHLAYSSQLQAKVAIFREQWARIAGLKTAHVLPIHPSTATWNYRNTLQFHLTPQGKLGYQEAHSSQVVAVSECFLPEGPLGEIWPQLDLSISGDLPLPDVERVALRVGSGQEMMIILEGSAPEAPELEVSLPVSVAYTSPLGTLILAGDDHLMMEVGGRPFRLSPGSFFQVNTAQAEAMVNYLSEQLLAPPGSTLVDVYCGVGLFSAFLAPRFSRCIGVEVSPSACEDFAVNLDEFDHVELYQGPAEMVLPELDLHPDVILVDPPRSGLERAAREAVLRMSPRQFVYVSCDPATLSRDARYLIEAGYELQSARPFDLFPQTFHIESINVFRRAE